MNNQTPITDISPKPHSQWRAEEGAAKLLFWILPLPLPGLKKNEDLTLLAFSVPKTIVYKLYSQHIFMANQLKKIFKKWA